MQFSLISWLLITLLPFTVLASYLRVKSGSLLILLACLVLTVLGHLSFMALFISVIFLSVAYVTATQKTGKWRLMFPLFTLAGCLLLGFHLLPGFHPLVYVESIAFSVHSPAFTIALSTDKVLAGCLLLLSGIAYTRVALPKIREVMIFTLGTTFVMVSLALLTGYVEFDPKLKQAMLAQAYVNLLVTCVIEEAFFRGVIQHRLQKWLKGKTAYAMPIAIGVTASLFAIAHYRYGLHYIGLAVFAGIGYGWIYARTQNLVNSILVHFSFNMIHMVGFTYPPHIS